MSIEAGERRELMRFSKAGMKNEELEMIIT